MNIEEVLNKIPPAPAGVENWVRKELIVNTYIIYNKKENKAICTRCGRAYKIDNIKPTHNAEGICPKCKTKGTYKASGIGRQNLEEYMQVLLFTRRGKTVYATQTNVWIDFTPFDKPNINKQLTAVYVFSDKECKYFSREFNWAGGEYWKEPREFKLKPPPQAMTWNRFMGTALYPKNLESVFKNSCLKYMWIPEYFAEHALTPTTIIKYAYLGLKYQSIELLIKAGFRNLVAQKVSGHSDIPIHWRGSSLQKILRMPRRHIKLFRPYNITNSELKLFKFLTEREKDLVTYEDIRYLTTFSLYFMPDLAEYVSLLKWGEYIKKLERRPSINDYLDYIKNCEKLGMDIERKDILFPRDFWKAHDEAAEKIDVVTNKQRDEALYKKTFEVLIEKENLICTMARTQTELNTESRSLNHCVRTYGDKIIKGQCYILFIRKTAEKDSPYYTLELDNQGKIIQCRGDHNCNMTDEIKSFVKYVETEFKLLLRKRNKEREAA